MSPRTANLDLCSSSKPHALSYNARPAPSVGVGGGQGAVEVWELLESSRLAAIEILCSHEAKVERDVAEGPCCL